MNKYNDHKVCNKCGQNNDVDSSFCSKCGEDIEYNKIELDGYTRTLELFIGNNSDFYIEKKRIMEEQNRIYSWNWAAFFISPIWFVYRKMYVLGIGLMFLNTISPSFIGILISISSGLYANTLYLEHVDKEILKLSELDENSKSEFISKKGGVSIFISIAVLILLFIIQYIFI